MKPYSLSTTICLLVLPLIFTACSSAAIPKAPGVEAQPAVEGSESAKAPESAEAPAPTAAPPPLPCTIAFDSNREGNIEVYRMAPDGSDTVNLTNNPGDDFDPAWSPDGSQIAFVSNRANDQDGGQFIYVINADGSDARQLNLENESKWPDWSHDGSRITYTNNDDIYVINADGSGQSINLTNSPEKDIQSTWSPDGSQIAWLSGNDGNWNIFVMDTDSGNIRQITDNSQINGVSWTVDGRILTSWGWKDQQEFCHNCVVNADGTNIVDGGGKGTLQLYVPFWTKSGDRVELASVDAFEGNDEIYLIGQNFPDTLGIGIGLVNLTNNPAGDRNPDWPANCGPNENVSNGYDEQEKNTQSQSPQQIVIGYENSENNMSEQKEADLLKACNELQIECIRSDSISKLAEQNVDAIISFSSRWHALGSASAFHDVVSKGILLIVLNAETGEPGAYNLSIESDSVQSSLEWMFKEMGETGEFVYYNFGQNGIHQSLIDQGQINYPGIKATSMPAEFEGNPITEESIASLATSNPNLEAIWTDEKLNDIFWGLKNGQVEAPPAILCEPRQDMLQFWKDWTNENSSFRCFSTIKPGGTAYEGVYVAYYILSGEEIDPAALGGNDGNTFIYDYPKITNDNLDEWLGKIDSFRKGEWDILELPPMTPEEIKEKWFLE